MPTTWTLEDLYRGIARGWKALAIVVIVCLALSYAAFRVFPEQYAATAVHTVEPISVLSNGSSFSTVNMDTEKIVASSTGVLEAAAAALDDGTSVRELADATELEVPRGSQILRFIVTTPQPSTSAAWANAIATAYGTQRSEAARAVVEQTSEQLQTTIDNLRETLESQPEGSPEAASTELQLEALVGEQSRLLATPFYGGSLITPAVEPSDSTRPSVLVFTAGGLFLGLLLGAFAALIWAGHLKRRDEVDGAAGVSAASTRHARARTRSGSQSQPTAAPSAPATTTGSRWPSELSQSPRSGTAETRTDRQRPAHAAPQPDVRTGQGLPARRSRQSAGRSSRRRRISNL